MSRQSFTPITSLKIPVTIVTGFLGAGKTSLLNHLITSGHGRRLAVLVNDFGVVNIDAALISHSDGEVISLENGCICCSLSDGLLAAVVRLLHQSQPPDHIIIETSGVSDPIEVARTFSDPELQPYAPLDGVVAVVDAELGTTLEGEMLNLARCQIAAADVAILNKIDIIDREQRELAKNWINKLAPTARLLEVTHGRAPLELLLGNDRISKLTASQFENSLNNSDEHHLEHNHDEPPFDCFTYQSYEPLSLQRLHALLSSLPKTVFRVKGILNLLEKPKHRCILQATGRRAAIEVGQLWADQQPITQIVFIGSRGGLDEEEILASLKN